MLGCLQVAKRTAHEHGREWQPMCEKRCQHFHRPLSWFCTFFSWLPSGFSHGPQPRSTRLAGP